MEGRPDPQQRPAPQSGPAGAPPHVRPGDAAALRISDADRHRVAEVLRTAAGDGRLDLDELDERLGAAYAAKTYGELVPLTADLPATGLPVGALATPAARPVGPGARHPTSVAIMSETRRVGHWVVEHSQTAVAVMGHVELDLREAQFTTGEVVIDAHAVMGEVRIVVDAGTTVLVEGVGIMGEFSEQRAKVPFDPSLGGPTVRVRGFALMGSVHVRRRGPAGPGLAQRLGLPGT